MVSKNSVILSYVPTNMLIVTDVESNINRLLRILRVIDVTGMGHQIVVVPLEYADANKMITLLTTVFQERGRVRRAPGAPDDQTVKFVADERTNSIVLLASEVEAERIKKPDRAARPRNAARQGQYPGLLPGVRHCRGIGGGFAGPSQQGGGGH